MSVKRFLVQHLRGSFYQPLWERLLHFAHVGMNYWGGAHYRSSGEVGVLQYVVANADARFGKLVLDVGADQGFYAETALGILPLGHHIVCFEPSSSSLAILRITLAEPIAAGEVSVVPIGLGATPGEAVLHTSDDGASVSSMYAFDESTRPWKQGATERLEISTLDAHCAAAGIERALFLKIDVEGHELAVLQGANKLISTGAIQFIQFEFGEAHIDARVFFLDIFRCLEKNYELHRILPNGLRRIHRYSPDLEVYRTANYLAVLRK